MCVVGGVGGVKESVGEGGSEWSDGQKCERVWEREECTGYVRSCNKRRKKMKKGEEASKGNSE